MKMHLGAVTLIFVLHWSSSLSASTILDNETVGALRRGEGGRVVESLREKLRVNPDDRALISALSAAYEQTAQDYFLHGEVAAAVMALEAAEQLLPDSPRIARSLAAMLMHDRQWDRAEVYLHKARAVSGQDRDVLWLLSRLCYATGRLDEAEGFVLQGLDVKPEDRELKDFLDKIRRERTVEDQMERAVDGNFTVTYEDGGQILGSAVLEVLGEAYVRLGREYNLYPNGPIPVIIYGQRDFITVIGAPGWSGGLYDGKIRLPVQSLTRMTDELRAVINHEFSHVLVRHVSHGRAPVWLHEGLAQIAEERWRELPVKYWTQALSEKRLIAINDMDSVLARGDRNRIGLVYEESYRFTRFLKEEFGWVKLLDLLDMLARGKSVAVACEENFVDEGGLNGLMKRWLLSEGVSNEQIMILLQQP